MLKHLIKNYFSAAKLFHKATPAFIFFALLITICCGKRKPPVPPVERVGQRVEISGFQRGSQVVLSWRMPARNAGQSDLLNISRADIYRLAEPANSARVLSEDEFVSRSTLIASLPISPDDFALQRLSYRDALEFAGQAARLRYAIRLVNASGQKAAFSNFLLIEPAAAVSANPSDLTADVLEREIKLSWTSPLVNIDGSQPVNILGYNIYRAASPAETGKLLNKTPVSESNFADGSFEYGGEYSYFVRAVSVGRNGEPVESGESNIVTIKPKDVFAPSPPSAITIAAAPNNIAIFFAVNPEKDIAGYRVYRSENRNLPVNDWISLTADLLTTNTFQDSQIESGKIYFYFLRAFDTNGNVSDPSVIVSEKAP